MSFTNRELDVMDRMVAKRWGISKTAKDLGISETRVRHIRNQIIVKLQKRTPKVD